MSTYQPKFGFQPWHVSTNQRSVTLCWMEIGRPKLRKWRGSGLWWVGYLREIQAPQSKQKLSWKMKGGRKSSFWAEACKLLELEDSTPLSSKMKEKIWAVANIIRWETIKLIFSSQNRICSVFQTNHKFHYYHRWMLQEFLKINSNKNFQNFMIDSPMMPRPSLPVQFQIFQQGYKSHTN